MMNKAERTPGDSVTVASTRIKRGCPFGTASLFFHSAKLLSAALEASFELIGPALDHFGGLSGRASGSVAGRKTGEGKCQTNRLVQ
jgi:hypothetical protein